jgi:steroid delta-isomerase-like uncharacterized protein
MSNENKEIIRRYLTLGPTNEELALGLLAEDAVYYDPGAPPSVGHEGQKQRTARLLVAFSDPQFVIHDSISEGDKVVARWTFSGTHSGPFGPIPATGKLISMDGITIYTLRDGKIAEARSNFDQMSMMQQLAPPASPPGAG